MTALAPDCLQENVSAVATRIVVRYLAAAQAAGKRLRDGGDGETLHDVRVALRRLRSLLRAYSRYLGTAGLRKTRRRLRGLGRASAEARDAEVQLAWLAAPGASPPEQAARVWLDGQLRARRDAAYRSVRSSFRSELAVIEKDLTRALAKARRSKKHGVSYGEATARLVVDHANELEKRLRAVHGAGDRVALHRARIAGKRLRYLIEPLAAFEPAAAEVLVEMKQLQDRVGDLGDAYVRTDELKRAAGELAAQWAPAVVQSLVTDGSDRVADPDALVGLFALALKAHTEIETGYAVLRERYLDARWLEAVRRLDRRLSGMPAAERRQPLKATKTRARAG
jgi:CHAD domain-containing protein